MELEDFVGEHELSGVDMLTEKTTDKYWEEDAQVMIFIIDGKTYKAMEDPSDGYRSCLSSLEETNIEVKNTFPAQKVIGMMKPDDVYSSNDTIVFSDAVTGEVVMEIGTDNDDDYYPCCVLYFNPEKMAINSEKDEHR